jgi:hypothetical protein
MKGKDKILSLAIQSQYSLTKDKSPYFHYLDIVEWTIMCYKCPMRNVDMDRNLCFHTLIILLSRLRLIHVKIELIGSDNAGL